ncbi:MAG: hydroxyethylthiazole kinase [Spirulinaceae cyanobacterium RM2_2_10]|nr:hydroxyethylthiazole kinase [Spirulinaceae cyanobacterium SM2_1_0]NJO21510.1 hydroxyethylthiazole kinase [Spirulinaceae cyanobacterium RM2_2_10]
MDADSLWQDLQTIRETQPLVHNIANYVTMNFAANALLALGASPVMAHASGEVAAMVELADALVINIGTLDDPWLAAMEQAMQTARQLGKPIALDPVGAGATPYRTLAVRRLLSTAKPAVIRGNASEILAVAAEASHTRGVDSTQAPETAIAAAQRLCQMLGSTVAITGAVDYILQGDRLTTGKNGHPLMTKVTGMGCISTALIGAFLAIQPDAPLRAATHAVSLVGIAGEIAAENACGPGSLQSHFLDTLYAMTGDLIAQRLKLSELA